MIGWSVASHGGIIVVYITLNRTRQRLLETKFAGRNYCRRALDDPNFYNLRCIPKSLTPCTSALRKAIPYPDSPQCLITTQPASLSVSKPTRRPHLIRFVTLNQLVVRHARFPVPARQLIDVAITATRIRSLSGVLAYIELLRRHLNLALDETIVLLLTGVIADGAVVLGVEPGGAKRARLVVQGVNDSADVLLCDAVRDVRLCSAITASVHASSQARYWPRAA
jgi:hypothetical protein